MHSEGICLQTADRGLIRVTIIATHATLTERITILCTAVIRIDLATRLVGIVAPRPKAARTCLCRVFPLGFARQAIARTGALAQPIGISRRVMPIDARGWMPIRRLRWYLGFIPMHIEITKTLLFFDPSPTTYPHCSTTRSFGEY